MDISFSTSWNNFLQTLTSGLNNSGGLHPFIVHIPIALLFVAPLFIIIGLLFKNSARAFYLSALTLLIIGTLGIFVAVHTGELASELIEPNPAIHDTLENHYHLAEKMRLNFSILTSIFLTYILLNSFLTRKFSPRIHQAALTFFLIVYAYNLVLLFNTAHQGGKLVHHHGITSNLYAPTDSNK